MVSRIGGVITALLGLAILFYGAQLALAGGSPDVRTGKVV